MDSNPGVSNVDANGDEVINGYGVVCIMHELYFNQYFKNGRA